jgi:hypothetical protein
MNSTSVGTGFFCLAAFLIACGGATADKSNDAKTATTTPPVSAPAATPATTTAPAVRPLLNLTGYTGVMCDFYPKCTPSGATQLAASWGDHDGCLAAYEPFVAKSLDLDGVTVTQAQLDVCVARMQDAVCETNFPECDFHGSHAVGDTCQEGNQCQSGSCEFSSDSADGCGRCVASAGAGERCPDFNCDVGLVCNSDTKICEPRIARGNACDRTKNRCEHELACVNGTCGDLLPIGSKCLDDGQGGGGSFDDCATGSSCDSKTLTCAAFPHVTAVMLGDACTPIADTGDLRVCNRSYCDETTLHCVPFPKEGEACKYDPGCGFGFECTNGKCIVPTTPPAPVCK